MNRFTESLDFPQNEQRRCLSLGIAWNLRVIGKEGGGRAPLRGCPSRPRRGAPPPGWRRSPPCVMTSSIRPYSLASCGDMKRSRSRSASTCSSVCPVWCARIWLSRWRSPRISLAAISMSAAVPWLPPRGLVQHDARVGKRAALALFARAQQDGAHAGRHADADGVHRRADVLHGVVDRQPRRHHPAGGVDVQVDVLFRVVGVQEQELGDDDVGHRVVHGAAQEHDPVHQQAAEDVVAALAPAGPLDHVRRIDGHSRAVLPGVVGEGRRPPRTASALRDRVARAQVLEDLVLQ